MYFERFKVQLSKPPHQPQHSPTVPQTLLMAVSTPLYILTKIGTVCCISNLYRHARNHDFQVFLVQTYDTYHSYLSHPVTFRCNLNKMPYLNPPGAALCVWELAMCKHDLSKSSFLKQCTQTKYPQANMHLRIKLSKNGPLSKLPNSLSKSIQVSSICTLRLLLHACAFLYIMYSIYSCIHVSAKWDQGQGKERCQPWKGRISWQEVKRHGQFSARLISWCLPLCQPQSSIILACISQCHTVSTKENQ